MAEREQRAGDQESRQPTAPELDRRKPYDRPRILSREPLEVMAATCTGLKSKASGLCTKLKS